MKIVWSAVMIAGCLLWSHTAAAQRHGVEKFTIDKKTLSLSSRADDSRRR